MYICIYKLQSSMKISTYIQRITIGLVLLASVLQVGIAQSIAREWNEIILTSIRNDLARPTVHARNLYHSSAMMYDIWAIYHGVDTHFLGKTNNGITIPFDGIPASTDIEADVEEAICHAMFTLLSSRFQSSPRYTTVLRPLYRNTMTGLNYNYTFTGTDYQSGDPAALGNYIAQQIQIYGLQDGSNQQNGYENTFYEPVNPPLFAEDPGNPDLIDLNKWQPLTLEQFVDQSGNVFNDNTPEFLGPEWGRVFPFALQDEDKSVHMVGDNEFTVYHEPALPPQINLTDGLGIEDNYKWGFSMVSVWSSHLDPEDPILWDISPASIGNIQSYPETYDEMRDFYNYTEGGDASIGHDLNPKTGQPYAPNFVPRSDYARVLAEFWADGPESETPPGHWFTILNYVSDNLEEKRFKGEGDVMSDLEWDIKTYIALGGAMHDCAITAWGLKGYVDYIRPISSIRGMAELGQSSEPSSVNYHPGGLPLVPNFIELVEIGDPLAGSGNVNVGKVKVYAWQGPDFIINPSFDDAGVGWILAENWWPYQRPTFITPNFAGFVSGHSTFSRAAAEVLTAFTGDPFFPGGMGEFEAPMNDFLVFEQGPTVDVTLQWATYRDASDQTSLSRIWGGIHPPADDIPGRIMGMAIAEDVMDLVTNLFYNDDDGDGFYSHQDCDDTNPNIYPNSLEICDNIDNDCDGETDENLPLFTYYADNDGDGFGNASTVLDVCFATAPTGFVTDNTDCDDTNPMINPASPEVCDNIDNNCNGMVNDGLQIYTYYMDNDGDGFGQLAISIDTCLSTAPTGFVPDNADCDDTNPNINPSSPEICDNLDNDCTGVVNDGLQFYTYYRDMDQDGFGQESIAVDTCITTAPTGFVANNQDCDDTDASIHPNSPEICDDIDNDCTGIVNDGLQLFSYYADTDGDGFGDSLVQMDTCITSAPVGFVTNFEDCNDGDMMINPMGIETADNGIDEDCSGLDYYKETKFFPNPVYDQLEIHHEYDGFIKIDIYNTQGKVYQTIITQLVNNATVIELGTTFNMPDGVYYLRVSEVDGNFNKTYRIMKTHY